jgi:hypothetical protein
MLILHAGLVRWNLRAGLDASGHALSACGVVGVTCIVGMKVADRVLIGGDSAAVSGYDLERRVRPKVFVNGPMVFGFTSSFRMSDLLEHALKVRERLPSVDVDKYMRTTFIDAVRKCLADGRYAKKDNNIESGGVFLVGYEARLSSVDSDFQVGESDDGFDAVGKLGSWQILRANALRRTASSAASSRACRFRSRRTFLVSIDRNSTDTARARRPSAPSCSAASPKLSASSTEPCTSCKLTKSDPG